MLWILSSFLLFILLCSGLIFVKMKLWKKILFPIFIFSSVSIGANILTYYLETNLYSYQQESEKRIMPYGLGMMFNMDDDKIKCLAEIDTELYFEHKLPLDSTEIILRPNDEPKLFTYNKVTNPLYKEYRYLFCLLPERHYGKIYIVRVKNYYTILGPEHYGQHFNLK